MTSVFANQKWQADYMACLGNSNPQRYLGVTLHYMNPHGEKKLVVKLDVSTLSLLEGNGTRESWYMVLCFIRRLILIHIKINKLFLPRVACDGFRISLLSDMSITD